MLGLKTLKVPHTYAYDQPVLWHRHPDVLAGTCTAAFHAMYAEHEAQIDIRTLEVIVGHLPKRALNGADLDPAWLHAELADQKTWSLPF
jgi:hypothetical protein